MNWRGPLALYVSLSAAACGPTVMHHLDGSVPADAAASSCTDGVHNGHESDVDCGGSCPTACADGRACSVASDCASLSCSTVCLARTCTDGIRNGAETGLDCGGPCPITHSGAGCVTGTNGSTACTTYTSGTTFTVAVTWNAAGGSAYVDYVTAYHGTDEFNAAGVLGGGAINVCSSGPYTSTFDLPLGDGYTYKIWHAYCVRTDACSGCGSDVTTDDGGPFGIRADCL